MQNRVIEISNYWAAVVRDTAEFQQIAIAENPEFNTLLECIYRVLKDGFIHEATDYGVSRWERILGLSYVEGTTLEERKVQVLTYLSLRRPYTMRVLKQILTSVLGENTFDLSVNNDTCTLHLSLVDSTHYDKIKTLLDKVLPQNLAVEINIQEGL